MAVAKTVVTMGEKFGNTARVKEILSWYESDNPGVKTNIARLLNSGRLAGTGKLRSQLSLRAGSGGRLQRARGAAWVNRVCREPACGRNPSHPEDKQPRCAA